MSAAVVFEGVSKRFILEHERPRSFQEVMLRLVRPNTKSNREVFWALSDVNFTLEHGQTLGIIGANGSGKSTVLKLIGRIIQPTLGRITVNGRVSALLELGAGFHPDLTGRENIYLNGAIMGMSRRQVNERFDEIVSFAELERFIDVPVKHYSSGMYLRLGFSVAVHSNPEILLVDEILAVGDIEFQRKCLQRINELVRDGVTIVFVSHNLAAVRNLCQTAIWLDEGVVRAQGDTQTVTDAYIEGYRAAHAAQLRATGHSPGIYGRWGSGEVEITTVEFVDEAGRRCSEFTTGAPFCVRIHYHAARRVENPVFGLAIFRNDGMHITGPNTRVAGYPIPYVEGSGYIDYVAPSLPLLEGSYDVTVAVHDETECLMYDCHPQMYSFKVRGGDVQERQGIVYIPSTWALHTTFPDKANHD